MSAACLLALLLVNDPVAAPVPPLAPDELRSAYAQALQASARKAQPEAGVVVPPLVELYRQLADDAQLSHAERSRMRRGVKARLEELRDRILREALAHERARQRAAYRSRASARPGSGSGLAGGGEAARAVELIELIQNTIAPESWNVNGGNGSIYYFSLLKVLVVRQTGEVHHQVGSGLSQLKN
jgi:hypothetical protein